MKKKCIKCHSFKEKSEFSFQRRSVDGRQKQCKNCASAYAKAWYTRNHKKVKVLVMAWRKKNPGKVLAIQRANNLKRYGLTVTLFGAMLAYQHNRCSICKGPFLKTPYVDHCHKSGKVRGLLCQFCNTGLGAFKDSIDFLKEAVYYLSK